MVPGELVRAATVINGVVVKNPVGNVTITDARKKAAL
jgi:hypothetical protein